jgi:hypothetical protein
MKGIALVLLLLLAGGSGCATPMKYGDKPLEVYDRDTRYRIDEKEGGFMVTVFYSRYQFIPESTAVATACKSSLTAIAHEFADSRRKKIKPVDEQRIRISMGRNGFTGITSCSATVPVEFKKEE